MDISPDHLINRTGYPNRVLRLVEAGHVEPVISDLLLDEIQAVAARPRIVRQFGVTDADRRELVLLLSEKGVPVELPVALPRRSRDPKDDYLIELAIEGGAAYLVTRDDNLKRDPAVVEYLQARGVEVVSVGQFLDLFEPLD